MSDRVLTHQSFRFALDPTLAQEEFLGACAGASRFWFNQGLALVKERLDAQAAGEDVRVPWSYQGLCAAFKGPVKDELAPWRGEVVIGSYQAGLEALGKALQNFSTARKQGRHVGFPRFRSKGRSHEAVIWQRPTIPDARHVLLDRRLGPVRCKESMRKLTRLLARDEHARILRSTVQRCQGGWVISFSVERSVKQRSVRRPNAAVGVDLGLSRLATLSTGQVMANSRPLAAAQTKLKRLQRQLDRQRRAVNPSNYLPDGRVRPGPKEWTTSGRMADTQRRVTRLHARVANLRREQAHALTTFLTREYGVIGVEDLAVGNMLKNRSLARAISDAGWGLILAQLQYKTAWAGSTLVAAGRFYPSSKTCSGCGTVKAKLSLTERTYTCESCGLVIDRDVNAAVNLAALAAQETNAYVDRIGRHTLNARGGHVSVDQLVEQPPVESCSPTRRLRGASQRGNALVVAA